MGISQDVLSWSLKFSDISYKVSYTFKSFGGTAKTARGKGLCKTDTCDFLVAVPVNDFESGDTNRNLRVQEVAKAALFPLVKFKISIPRNQIEGNFKAKCEIEFAGKTHSYENIEFKVSKNNSDFVVNSQFDIYLEDFSIERPKLMTIAIDNKIPIIIHSTWSQ